MNIDLTLSITKIFLFTIFANKRCIDKYVNVKYYIFILIYVYEFKTYASPSCSHISSCCERTAIVK